MKNILSTIKYNIYKNLLKRISIFFLLPYLQMQNFGLYAKKKSGKSMQEIKDYAYSLKEIDNKKYFDM